jgi:hypothetical protein
VIIKLIKSAIFVFFKNFIIWNIWCILPCGARGQNPESRINNQESRIQNPESRIKNPESRIQNQESRIKNPESRIPFG